ncbi:UDP-2,4-diacetamido-2,4,6-trideoxy-beta-L-altropyranose hydrolase [Hymenobacter crusticola]|uniref:UDP-2,4-diacetamido-2,4, 6-trideoxy-beta-L-altropyranose hydrolase n=1 Tax=Hymenobacter crusticola TaxID=1770526 RepID=A0A243WAV3_9BACT|nr:UDP-2,4-diacetamido-2,4,6-trideoxy-beta-L-altropyranose hydrolase [Hymenobacter crusticola]OUJ72698.1 UDP-2,4-diacetamido-2,4,6-trideoxy-beta-L-altropyranose hydrolase [Hymenobacter crusticola]
MRLIFRADGNAQIGLGHVVRSLALADIVRTIGECLFAIQEPSVAIRQLLAMAQVQLLELPATLDLATEAAQLAVGTVQATDLVVLDGYSFDAAYRQQLRTTGCRLVVIDDLRFGYFDADLLINHSPGVTRHMYHTAPHTRFCLGPAFSLLRKPFLAHAQLPEPTTCIDSILLCFGGADPVGLTPLCLSGLVTLPSIQQIGIITGSAFQHSVALKQTLVAHPDKTISTYQNLDAYQMVLLFKQYQAVVCPASTILIESLFLGKACLTGSYIENQQALADYVHVHQQAYSIGDFTTLSAAALHQALVQGLAFLQNTQRQPYVVRPSPEQLHAEFQHLAQA